MALYHTETRFNPVLGFLPAATPFCWTLRVSLFMFQSRAGFSPCRDGWRRVGSLVLLVSIPCWVFSLPRPAAMSAASATVESFNPLLGFLPAATAGISGV